MSSAVTIRGSSFEAVGSICTPQDGSIESFLMQEKMGNTHDPTPVTQACTSIHAWAHDTRSSRESGNLHDGSSARKGFLKHHVERYFKKPSKIWEGISYPSMDSVLSVFRALFVHSFTRSRVRNFLEGPRTSKCHWCELAEQQSISLI
jgi:hypothetical protein